MSRTLLPYTRRNLYREVAIKEWRRFALLRRTLTERPELGELVDYLDVSIGKEHQGAREPDSREMLAVLATLSELQSLEISGCPDLLLLLVSEEVCLSHLPSLTSIFVIDSFYGNPFGNPDFF